MKENECLTYQEEIELINKITTEILENEITINNRFEKIIERFEKIERKIKFHDIINIIIMIILMIIFIFWR